MKEILEDIIKSMVVYPDEVKIEEIVDEERPNTVKYKVTCKKEELGKVIGKKGRTANAIRTLVRSIGQSDKKKIYVDFI